VINAPITLALDSVSRVHSAAGVLIRTQLPSGFFPYDFNFSTGAQSDMAHMEGFNLVRQTGAAFSLAEYHSAFPDKDSQYALEKFLRQVSNSSLPIGKGATQQLLENSGLYNRWQLWRPLRNPLYRAGLLFSKRGDGKVVAVDGDYERAWSGATALSLLTAVKYYSETGNKQFNDDIQFWKTGLYALHVTGRGFREAPHYLTESAYVNGEAWLALAEYLRVFPDDVEARNFLQKLDNYLIEKYGGEANNHFYSWGTMAAAVRARDVGDPKFLDFVVKLAALNLDEKEKKPTENANSCASVEGLVTFVDLMGEQGRNNEATATRSARLMEQLMEVNNDLQLGARSAEILQIDEKYLSKLNDYEGAFILSLQEPLMQVDLTQHCLNALLRLDEAGY
jgi:hypothetical protein